MKTKICSLCKKKKSISKFHINSCGKLGRDSRCKICKTTHRKRWYEKNREKELLERKNYYRQHTKESYLQSTKTNYRLKYNITLEQYDLMFEMQGGKCAICNLPELNRRLSIDHDHKTGKIRGLLCVRCNVKLSTLEDNEFVTKAKRYLKNCRQ